MIADSHAIYAMYVKIENERLLELNIRFDRIRKPSMSLCEHRMFSNVLQP